MNEKTLREVMWDPENQHIEDGGLKRVLEKIVEEIEKLQNKESE